MAQDFEKITDGITRIVELREPLLAGLDERTRGARRNSQGRTVSQITGHMIDSASNNLHRIIHLQYGPQPLVFPNYATGGNNDRWIAIQDYEGEDWLSLVRLWKYINLHLAHVIRNIDPAKTGNVWIAGPGVEVTLEDMVHDYLRHMELHMREIEELIALPANP